MNTDYVERVREKPQPKTTKKRKGFWYFLAGAALGISQSENIVDYSKESISSVSQVVSQKIDRNYIDLFIKSLKDEQFFVDNKRELENLKGLANNATKDDAAMVLKKYDNIISKMKSYKIEKSIEEKNKMDVLIRKMEEEKGRFLSYISSK